MQASSASALITSISIGVHIWDQITPVEEVMRGLDDLVRQGKVLYVGISDAPAWWVAQANTLAQLRGWSPFVGLQIEYSLIERTVEPRVDSDGEGAESGRDGMVTIGWRSADRQIPRPWRQRGRTTGQ